MAPSARRKLFQFSLRGILLLIAGCSVALGVWRMPFEADITDRKEFVLLCGSGMSEEQLDEYSREQDAKREKGVVYRDFQGNWVKHGLAVLYDGNGVKLRENHWSHGKLEGIQSCWNSKGELHCQCSFRDGKKHGWETMPDCTTQRWYYENDVLLREEDWSEFGRFVDEYHADGSKTCVWWSPQGIKRREFNRDANRRLQGGAETFHASGKISSQGSWRDNRENGVWTWWDEQGNVTRRIDFKAGIRQPPSPTACRDKFVPETWAHATLDAERVKILFAPSYVGAHHPSLTVAIECLDSEYAGRRPPLRIQALGAEATAFLESTRPPQEARSSKLRDALQSLARPLGLEAVAHDNGIWIVDADEGRAWVEAIPVSRFVSVNAAYSLYGNHGLSLGRTALQGLLDALKIQKLLLRVDERITDSLALLEREIDADIPGCSFATALDIVLNEISLTFHAENDKLVIVPLESP